jgi:LysM repeat protein
MDGRLRALDAAREKDRQELLDRLSSKMSEILRGHAASSSARRPAARRQASDTGYEHEVKPGETLSAIAAAYGVSVKAILDNNDVKNPDRLQVGQRLFIPD